MTKKTKRMIRKTIIFARGFFLSLFGVCLLLVIMSADGPYLWFPITCSIVGILCFGIAYAIDYVIWWVNN